MISTSAKFVELLFCLVGMRGRSLHDISTFTLEHGTAVTGSRMGFLGFVSDDESTYSIHAWSAEAMAQCQIEGKPLVFDVAKAGWWGDALRSRVPLVVNDYSVASPRKLGIPSGHVPIERFLCVPLVHDDKVVMAMGVSNKPQPYTDHDVAMLEMIQGALWTIHGQQQELDDTYARLETSDAMLRDLSDSLPGALFQLRKLPDGAWSAPFVSERFRDVLGLTPAQIQQDPLLIPGTIAPEDRDRVVADMQRCLLANTAQHLRFRTCVDGGTRYIETHAKPRTEPDGTVVWNGVFIDATEIMGLEAQLLASQKLEAIGRLAAGVAHEINTPMQYIGDNTRFIQQSCRDFLVLYRAYDEVLAAIEAGGDPEQAIARCRGLESSLDIEYLSTSSPAAVEDCLDGIHRVSEIVAAMKSFAHPGRNVFEPTDINAALRTTLIVSRNEWKYVATTEEDLDPSVSHIPALTSELNQVWLNLVINAAHAIEDKTKVTGELGKITVSTRSAAEAVVVTIRDTGQGIPHAARPRLFEPFFTTKPEGKGTGQGLAIAWDIVVNKHRGKIWFETELGVGTAFHVELPRELPPQDEGAT